MSMVLCVVGARPNFMKMAPILRAMESRKISYSLLHTGQHSDYTMSGQMFEDLGLPEPRLDLKVTGGTHAEQTAEVMRRFEPVMDEWKPACVLVVGDVNSTLACTLVAVKKGVPVAHVEAGLRSYDRSMPEEINRVLVDQIADVLYTSETGAADNLLREGVDPHKIVFVGNVMIDTLLYVLPRTMPSGVKERYGVATIHRPSNVDSRDQLEHLLRVLLCASDRLPILLPLHPRTRNNISRWSLDWLLDNPRLTVLPPLSYLKMLSLLKGATLVLTDSGGVQEETTALGVPCLTMRQNTERPVTVRHGTNTLVGTDMTLILKEVDAICHGAGKKGTLPVFWDGHAAERIVADLTTRFHLTKG